jgi:hypothetical protein
VNAVLAEWRELRVSFQPGWGAPTGKGLLANDQRVRTLRRVLVTFPEVRHILPDRISVDVGADARLLESIAVFLKRQRWLVKAVEIR